MKDKQALIERINNELEVVDFTSLDLNDEEAIAIEYFLLDIGSIEKEELIEFIKAEKIIWDNNTKCWTAKEKYGEFENVEELLNFLEKKEILTFKKD